ncbi:hypothetical protein D3C73_1028150 [compost metagenome]
MRIDTDVHLRIGGRLRQIDDLLPEGPPQYRSLPGMHHPQPKATQLHIAATHHYRRTAQQATLLGRLFGDVPQYSAGFFHR